VVLEVRYIYFYREQSFFAIDHQAPYKRLKPHAVAASPIRYLYKRD